MIEPTITCPNCKTEIKLTESLAAPLIEATCRELEQRLEKKAPIVANWLIGREIVEDQQLGKKRAGYGEGRPANSNAVRTESPGSRLSDANSDAVRRKSDASGAARYVAG